VGDDDVTGRPAADLIASSRSHGVVGSYVLVAGHSRGGEAALLLGAFLPQLVNGVIAGVPSSVVNPGWPDQDRPAWTLGGRPLPAVSTSEFGQPAHQFAYPVTALRYHDAGHLVGGLTAYYGSLTDDALTSVGGTVAGTQAARADAHTKPLALLASQ
jgi:pimeloyl-ACP methyl ester carboxylesterase